MNTTPLQQVKPEEIEAESFRIIEAELGPTSFSQEEFTIVRRVIHATGDFSFSDNMRIHADAVAAGIRSITSGKNILTDVQMVASGISKKILAKWGGEVISRIADPETAQKAKEEGLTRSEAAMELSCDDNIGIVAIGNAPTALLKLMELVESGRFTPDLIIGVPVGFVNAEQSKAILAGKNFPFITSLGRKGGSPVAAATVNALLRLADK